MCPTTATNSPNDHTSEGTLVTDVDTNSSHLGYANPNRGRPLSWVCVVIMIASFAVGGIGVAIWNWLLVGICAGIFAVAGIVALAGGIMKDVH